jgi:hypothetical protein
MTETDDVRTKKIAQVEKCLRLAERAGTEAEAQAALLRAQELMYAHGIEAAELKVGDDAGAAPEIETTATDWLRRDVWVNWLHKVIARNFRCRSIISVWRNQAVFKFVGYAEDARAALAAFESMRGAGRNLASKYCDRYRGTTSKAGLVRARESYLRGFVAGIEEALETQVETQALMVVAPKAVEEAADELCEGRVAKGPKSSIKPHVQSVRAGYLDGLAVGAGGRLDE